MGWISYLQLALAAPLIALAPNVEMAIAAPASPASDPALTLDLANKILAALSQSPRDSTEVDREAEIASAVAAYPKKDIVLAAFKMLLQRTDLPRGDRRALVNYAGRQRRDRTTYAGLNSADTPDLAAGPSVNGDGTGVNYGH
jgi:hypothetical protein